MLDKYYSLLLLLATVLPANLAKANPQPLSLADKLLAQQNIQDHETVPASKGEIIVEIEVRFVDKQGNPTEGKTRPDIITREFDFQPGDIYDAEIARKGLERVNKLVFVNQATLTLEPAFIFDLDRQESSSEVDRVVMIVTVEESNTFFFAFGLTLQPPTALQGSARPTTVIPMSNKANGLSSGVRFGVLNLGGDNQALTLGLEGGQQNFGLDLDYRKFIKHDRGYAVNFFTRKGVEPEFDGGDRDVDLPGGDDPWVDRLGGEVEFFRPIVGDFQGALGVSYQLVSVRNRAFTSRLNPVDELGNPLTISNDGQDELLTINFATALDRRNSKSNTTKGYRFLFQTDQSIPVGDASILSNRLAANYTQYLPLPLFGFSEGARTLVLNLQGGTIIGDLPPYEAFNLGGSSSVRGYGGGELGTGRSFVQATAEYRFPIFSLNAFKEKLDVGGTLFVDYATDLGSGDTVTGEPAIVRDKPGHGLGYGAGLRTITPIGVVRLEVGFNDRGDSEIILNIGDRF